MANFSVTVTEILGTDSMNNSRVTINNNFKTLADSINSLVNNYFTSTNEIGNSTCTMTSGTVNTGTVNISSTGSLKIGQTSLSESQLIQLLEKI